MAFPPRVRRVSFRPRRRSRRRSSIPVRRCGMAWMLDARDRALATRRAALAAMLLAGLSIACASGGGVNSSSSAPGTLVAIFAHPDDETIVSPALAHYAREGTKV